MSKNQGWILLAGTIIMGNYDLFDSGSNFDTGICLFFWGLTVDLVSIPFFISSVKIPVKLPPSVLNIKKMYFPHQHTFAAKLQLAIILKIPIQRKFQKNKSALIHSA